LDHFPKRVLVGIYCNFYSLRRRLFFLAMTVLEGIFIVIECHYVAWYSIKKRGGKEWPWKSS